MQILKTWKNQKKFITQEATTQALIDTENGEPFVTEAPDVIGHPDRYVVTLFDNPRGKQHWIEVYEGVCMAEVEAQERPDRAEEYL